VGTIDQLKHIKWVVEQSRLRAGTEHACIVQQRIQATHFSCSLSQPATMPGISHIASYSDYPRMARKFSASRLKRFSTSRIDNQIPAQLSEPSSQRQTQTTRCPRNQGRPRCICCHSLHLFHQISWNTPCCSVGAGVEWGWEGALVAAHPAPCPLGPDRHR